MKKIKEGFNFSPILFVLALVVAVVTVFSISRKVPKQLQTPEPLATPNTSGIISGSFDQSLFRPDEQWKQILTSDQYNILRQAGTEAPFSGVLDTETRSGTYYSVGCNEPIFRSEQKYDSGTGWPSFWTPVKSDALVLREDNTIPLEPRVEVLDKCGNHLGHVFNDGPKPTGKRYCMNSLALKFVPDK